MNFTSCWWQHEILSFKYCEILFCFTMLMAFHIYHALCTDTSPPSQPVYVNPAANAMLVNRRLVLKQLPSGQFALTVQSAESGVLGGPFLIASSHAADTSTGNIAVGSSCEPSVADSHVCHVSCLVTLLSWHLLFLNSWPISAGRCCQWFIAICVDWQTDSTEGQLSWCIHVHAHSARITDGMGGFPPLRLWTPCDTRRRSLWAFSASFTPPHCFFLSLTTACTYWFH